MGIIGRESPFRLVSPHSDYDIWEQNNKSANEKGLLIKAIIEQYVRCENLTILNLGPDIAGIHKLFNPVNEIVNYDCSYLRLKRHSDSDNNSRIEGDFLSLPFKNKSFDLIIIQNVLEQVSSIAKFLEELNRILKTNSIIFLSTPNKFSLINIISDPYSGLPFAALSTRGKKINHNFIRMFSLKRLKKHFQNLEFHLNTMQSIRIILSSEKIMELSSHPVWLKFLKFTGLSNILLRIINNKPGFINSYLTPTFYLVLKN
jgi:ubiquinone/menaquinone biosynthesis C-methylase UbiE